ncbi:hypothetical protein OS189_08800 [Sulfitobacter sp. F26169L]|uniref:hypothetical protein n=1 Tax=Sulfitobacter sp. F26169L TaxID=2996015 RepID=UPI002260A246|nr:hypothetical protein [Sulfitobacter sp. F26169L]MCX7566438.1 hypothetical protein [Sulfitobacter sp. F26169L]
MTATPDTRETDKEEILAFVQAGAGRRVLGMGSLGLLGLLLIYIAIVQSPALEWRLFLLALGVGTLWTADKMRRATASRIELTETELRDSDGTVIARIADIDGMDRGFFAFKPSNGFLLRTTDKGSNQWRPGLWWRLGRRIGVGGMTPASQTKYMSEIIAAIMAQRDIDKSA